MARSRRGGRSLGYLPQIRSRIREMLQSGSSIPVTRSVVSSEFPQVSTSTITTMVNQESGRTARRNTLLSTNRGQFVNIPRLLGCGPGTAPRARIVVSGDDMTTGKSRRFGFTVPLRASGRLRDILNEARDAVLDEALLKGYEIGPSVNAEIAYVDCV